MMPANGTALAPRDGASIIEAVIAQGDLEKLSPEQRISYYRQVCLSIGLNELTQPFQYIKLNGKLTLYAGKGCTDQLREIKDVSITKIEKEEIGDLFVVTAYATRATRQDSEIGAVSVAGLRGEALANAMMKAITKAKRRVTLSICGLGMLDESEVDSIPDAQHVVVDGKTGEVVEHQVWVAEDNDPAWVEWCNLGAQAARLNIKAPRLERPISVSQLRGEYAKLRGKVKAKQAAAVTAETSGAAGGASVVGATAPAVTDLVTDKNDPDWKAWLEAERKARIAGSDVDTSAVKLPTSRADLQEFTKTLREPDEEEEAF